MSRRFRVEEEKAQQLNQDLQEEEDKIKLQKARIFGPIVWARLDNGIRIEDLKPKYFEDTLDMIEQYFVTEDVVFRNTDIVKDPQSLNSFREKLLHNMKDLSSIVVIDENNENPVAGVLILKALKKCDFGRVFSRVYLSSGKAYSSIINFLNYFSRHVDLFETFSCEIYLRYYLICIRPEYRKRNLGYRLMLTGLDIARHLEIPIVMGIFDCFKLQKLAKRLGMQTVFEIHYSTWIDKTGELKFCDPGAGNYTCALMAGEVPPPPPPEPVIEIVEEVSQEKLTRAIKRKMSQKQK